MDQDQGAPSTGSVVSSAVLAAVVESYYPDAARAGTAARVRAQAAQSIATVFAAGVVATATLTDLKAQLPPLRVVGCLAAVFWSIAAILYMRAVGKPAPLDERLSGVNDDDELVRIVLQRAKIERDSVDKWQRQANLSSLVALVLTAATFIGAVFLPEQRETMPAVFVPTQQQWDVINSGCSTSGPTLTAAVEVSSLDTDTPVFILDCHGKKARLRIPKSDIKGLITFDR